jgi:hypothetical protein
MIYPATSLIGGGIGALDAIDGAGLANMDIAFVMENEYLMPYWLDADSGLDESYPGRIKPDTNAGDKRWVLFDGIGVPHQDIV